MPVAQRRSINKRMSSSSDDETNTIEEGRSSLATEESVGWEKEERRQCTTTRLAATAASAAAAVLLVGGATFLVSAVMRSGADDTTVTPDNQLFGDEGSATAAFAFGMSKMSKSSSSSHGSVSIRLEPKEDDNDNDNNSTDSYTFATSERPEQQCLITPNGWTVMAEEEEFQQYPAVDTIFPKWDGLMDDMSFGLQQPDHLVNRTFDVEPNHTVLDNGQQGVIFNVETTPDALPEDVRKPRLTPKEIQTIVEEEASRFYRTMDPSSKPPNVTLEVISAIQGEGDNLIFAGGQGFVASAMIAFAYHLPLALTPDHLWALITSGFAYHVNQYPEELRYNFVKHEGQVDLEIREDSLRMGETPPHKWEELVFPRFTEEVGKNMNNTEVFDLIINTNFTTSTPTSQAASQITLMAAMKAFFRYTMVTLCGIPRIKLEGTRQDWQQLRARTAQLAQWMMPNHPQGDLWIQDVVLPILDEFLQAYDGNVNYCFWQSMVKFRLNQDSCDTFDFLSGWLPTLFPYLDAGGTIMANRYLRHWTESSLGDVRGPEPAMLPIQMSSAPVRWNYFGVDYPVHFHAGFRGVSQQEDDRDGGMVRPVLGWYITHDP